MPAYAQDAVCARVRIQIEQEAVLTRTAFDAHLQISNAAADADLRDINVVLDIRDANGQFANHLFGVSDPELTNLTGVHGQGVLNPGQTGSAHWLIVPYEEAAPTTGPTEYFVGGEFSYVQNNALVVIPLYPVRIEVWPDAKLFFNYYLQSRIDSDDPFTDEIEPTVPFALGLLVRNEGLGQARNLRIRSSDPEIIDNEKGLLIAFNLIGTQVGTSAVSPSLNVNLGDIPAGGRSVARWLMSTNLQGRFCHFEASFEHVGSLGDPRLSLLKDVDIYLMHHVVRVDHPADDDLPDFLVIAEAPPPQPGSLCTIAEGEDELPTVVHSSTGEILPIHISLDGTTDGPPAADDLNVQLDVNLAHTGWHYIRVDDPSTGEYQLAQVVRNDGKIIRMGDNAWRTRRIKRPEGTPENDVHLFDYVETPGPASYTVTFVKAADPSPADLDGDGDVDGVDFGLFLAARGHSEGDPAYNPAADLDGDGTVTFVDQQLWLAAYRAFVEDQQATAPTPIFLTGGYRGDLDGDEDVDMVDFGLLQQCLTGVDGTADPACEAATLDADNDVDVDDLQILIECAAGSAVTPSLACRK